MGDGHFQELLESMPQIAEAVNRFDSPEVQSAAFAALIGAALGDLPPEAQPFTSAADTEGKARSTSTAVSRKSGKSAGRSPTKKASKKSKLSAPPIDETVDISPSDTVSLPDFAKEKQPSNMQDQSMVIIYWLKAVAGVSSVGLSQVYTCYKKLGWRAPKNPGNQLQVIAARQHWLDTSSMEDIDLTHSGTQHVEHDLPSQPKS